MDNIIFMILYLYNFIRIIRDNSCNKIIEIIVVKLNKLMMLSSMYEFLNVCFSRNDYSFAIKVQIDFSI